MITQALVLIFGFIVLQGNTADSPLLKATSAGSSALEERGAWRKSEFFPRLSQELQQNASNSLWSSGETSRLSETLLESENKGTNHLEM